MKQVVQSYRTGELQLADVPVPRPRPGSVLVQTAFSAISLGTEGKKVTTARQSMVGKARSRPDQVEQVLQTVQREGIASAYRKVMDRLDQPISLGYSTAGTVIAVGENAEAFRVGDRVACAGEGIAAHAEVNAIPINLCVKVPDDVPLEAAAFSTLGAIAMQGVRQADVSLGETVVVLGLGLVGQLVVQLLKAAGCRVIGIDLDPDKAAFSEKLGADWSIVRTDPDVESKVLALTRGRGADVVVIAAATSSSDPVKLSADLCRDRGRVVSVGHVGLGLPRQVFYDKELSFTMSRSYGPGRYDPLYEEKGVDYPLGYVRWTENRNMEAFLDLIAAGKVNMEGMLTHRFKFEEAEQAYDLLASKDREGKAPLGVLFEYDASKDHLAATAQKVLTVDSGPTDVLDQQSGLGVGFIGAGSFARKFLVPPLAKYSNVRLVGVATATGISAKHVADKFGFSYSTGDYQQLLEDSEIQCIFIATRHNLHAQIAVEALRAGKVVFVEKPLALNWEQLEQVVTAQRETGGHLMVGFNRRFAPFVQEMQEFFGRRTEPMVAHYRVNAGYLEPDHWYHDPEEGGGRIMGEACHMVDLLAYLADSPIERVYAMAMDNVGRYHDDNVEISLQFADGSIGSVLYLANGDTSLRKERVEVHSLGNSAVLDDYQRLSLHRGNRAKTQKKRQDKGHRNEVSAFIEAIQGGKSLPLSFSACVESTAASLAAVDSLATGLPLVRIGDAWAIQGAAPQGDGDG